MLKKFVATVTGVAAFTTGLGACQGPPPTAEQVAKWKSATLYDMKVTTLDGKDADLKDYAGKVTLIVNVASHCGYTNQYAALQKLYDANKDKGLVILAFPSGDFGGQEFADAKEIREFCDTKFHVTFPMFEKCGVKAGPKQSIVFECLSAKTGELPGWNFGKYVVGRDGKTAVYFSSGVAPDDKKLMAAIDAALAVEVVTPAAAPKS